MSSFTPSQLARIIRASRAIFQQDPISTHGPGINRFLKRGLTQHYLSLFPSHKYVVPADLDERRERAIVAARNKRLARAAKAKNTYQTPKK